MKVIFFKLVDWDQIRVPWKFLPRTGESFVYPTPTRSKESEILIFSDIWAICQRLGVQKSRHLRPPGFVRLDCQIIMLFGAFGWDFFVLIFGYYSVCAQASVSEVENRCEDWKISVFDGNRTWDRSLCKQVRYPYATPVLFSHLYFCVMTICSTNVWNYCLLFGRRTNLFSVLISGSRSSGCAKHVFCDWSCAFSFYQGWYSKYFGYPGSRLTYL